MRTQNPWQKQNGVDIRLYRVIYQAIEDVEAAMKVCLSRFTKRKLSAMPSTSALQGIRCRNDRRSYVLDGTFQRLQSSNQPRRKPDLRRKSGILKRFKDDVKEVRSGYECGLVFEGFNDLQEFDQVEAYIMVEVPR